jgi:hypothetical protein
MTVGEYVLLFCGLPSQFFTAVHSRLRKIGDFWPVLRAAVLKSEVLILQMEWISIAMLEEFWFENSSRSV